MNSVLALVLGALGGAVALVAGMLFARKSAADARRAAKRILEEARADASARAKEVLVSAQEKHLAVEEEADRREREIEGRETQLEQRAAEVEKTAQDVARRDKDVERRRAAVTRAEESTRASEEAAKNLREEAQRLLEKTAGLSALEARAELVAGIEEEARREATKVARRIEDEARESAARDAKNLIVQAAERANLREVVETTVTSIDLPNDELKGRIIGREGRNIRALEMATGIDLIVDDTPRAILVSSFDPLRRQVARVAIDKLVEDGRIHPARIEEVVEKVRTEMETLVEEAGVQAAFDLGVTDLHPRLSRLVGRMRYLTNHGQNLLQHSVEVALIASHMAAELGAREEVVRRAGLLHEVGRADDQGQNNAILLSADLAAKLGESEAVVHAIQAMHPEVESKTVEALLVRTANRLSDTRPGARKENLEVFIERLRRLESIAASFPGVLQAFAVKAGKEVRVLVDTKAVRDEDAYALSKEIARALERDLTYSGQIKVSVIRETRAVQYAV